MSVSSISVTRSGNLPKYSELHHFGLNIMAMRTIESNLRNGTITQDGAVHALMFYNIYTKLKAIAENSENTFTQCPALFEQYKFMWLSLGVKEPSTSTQATTASE
jgi:hypothetical protein